MVMAVYIKAGALRFFQSSLYFFQERMNQIKQLCRILMKEYGHQGWWPIINDKTLLCEYHVNAPRNEKEALEICFGAIMAQNTQWHPNVVRAIQQLNKNSLIEVNKILGIENEKLAHIIKSSGYNNQKAKKLKNFCEFLLKKHNGSLKKLFKSGIKNLREELLSVNGIGPETADSIILYAAQKPIFVIDAYTKRILNRVGYKENTYDALQKLFMKNLQNNEKLFNECHALLVKLGKDICKKEPLCQECPLSAYCSYYKNLHRK